MKTLDIVIFCTAPECSAEGVLLSVNDDTGMATILCLDDMEIYHGEEYQLEYTDDTTTLESITLKAA